MAYTFKLFSPMWANLTCVPFLIHFFGSGGIKPLYWGPSGKGRRAGRTMRSDIFHPARISATSRPPKSFFTDSFLRFLLCEILNCLNLKIKSLQLYTNNKIIILIKLMSNHILAFSISHSNKEERETKQQPWSKA